MARCEADGYEEAVAQCKDCGRSICPTCLVHVRRFVLCTHCALVRAGVRRRGGVLV
jgi:hypothetical protein